MRKLRFQLHQNQEIELGLPKQFKLKSPILIDMISYIYTWLSFVLYSIGIWLWVMDKMAHLGRTILP